MSRLRLGRLWSSSMRSMTVWLTWAFPAMVSLTPPLRRWGGKLHTSRNTDYLLASLLGKTFVCNSNWVLMYFIRFSWKWLMTVALTLTFQVSSISSFVKLFPPQKTHLVVSDWLALVIRWHHSDTQKPQTRLWRPPELPEAFHWGRLGLQWLRRWSRYFHYPSLLHPWTSFSWCSSHHTCFTRMLIYHLIIF